MKRILLTIWQLPQNILGALLVLIMKAEASFNFHDTRVFFSAKMSGGICLGRYIIMRTGSASPHSLCHEWGHSRQSLYLGWLYLPVVGLPSLLWAALYKEKYGSYYSFWTERWADRLGGVER